jgi:cellulose synthase/poly-beta-1,6-N-acetylglucosamine synthase-like glycosyltransferase
MTFFILITGILLIVYLTAGMIFLVGLFMPEKRRGTVQPFVSIIIAARNEEQNIKNCMEGLVRQTYPAGKYEIIVIDDRSEDRTGEIVREFSKQFPQIRLLRIESKPEQYAGKKYALDRGITESKGSLLLFTDADCTVKETWVEGMVSYFEENVGAVIGFSSVKSRTFFEQWQDYDFMIGMTATCGAVNLGFPLAASGQNLAYRREAFEQVGGFEKIKQRISGDDTLMIQLFRKYTKFRIVFASDPKTFNETKPMSTLVEFIHQRSRWASNGTIMLNLNPFFFFYLVCLFLWYVFLMACLPMAFFQPSIAVIVGLAWLSKWVIDFAVGYVAGQMFRKKFYFAAFSSWFFLQPPLILLVGIRGAFGFFRWK